MTECSGNGKALESHAKMPLTKAPIGLLSETRWDRLKNINGNLSDSGVSSVGRVLSFLVPTILKEDRQGLCLFELANKLSRLACHRHWVASN